ncbi:MAG: hypothetical protein LQ348_000723 [Seirophora lacunosa]|nr:MAG: hypothetical protein LQ348_000723 [Seirophora lacunosa]
MFRMAHAHTMPLSTAFTAVTARRTFGKPLTAEEARPSPSIVPSTSPSSTPAATPKGKRDWPLPVRTYVQRCFAEENILPDVKLQEMEVKLKQVISKAVETDGRKKRFEPTAPGTSPVRPWRTSTAQEAPPQEREGPIVGRCQELEKKYFRLTSAPNPDTVRPLPILEKTLDHLKRRWKQERNYSYICDQFKSLRQDLTVQRIKNGFTVNAYEIHARIALEKGDLSEYNQCQTQLRALYAQKLGGHPAEFMAYRILYFLHTSNRIDMNDVLADLTPTEKQDRAVKHALETRSALALGNYHRFFELYLDTPNMGAYLMDMFVARERLAALSAICRAYKPDIKLRFVTEELGFESDDESARFICDHGAQHLLEERDDGVRLVTGKASTFFEPALKAASARPGTKLLA